MCGAEFRKLALEFAEANKIQNPFNKTKKQKKKLLLTLQNLHEL
jgi:hypothetical protein